MINQDQQVLRIPAIGCDGCVRAIRNELGQLPGVEVVSASVTDKTVTVHTDGRTDWEKIRHALTAIGYAPQ